MTLGSMRGRKKKRKCLSQGFLQKNEPDIAQKPTVNEGSESMCIVDSIRAGDGERGKKSKGEINTMSEGQKR